MKIHELDYYYFVDVLKRHDGKYTSTSRRPLEFEGEGHDSKVIGLVWRQRNDTVDRSDTFRSFCEDVYSKQKAVFLEDRLTEMEKNILKGVRNGRE